MAAERVIRVEHLLPSMSKDLLTKFPDNSAFGFDYSLSGIWSPLVPRTRSTSVSVSCPFMGSRKLLFDGYEKMSQDKQQQLARAAAAKGKAATKQSGGFYCNKKKSKSKKKSAAKKSVVASASVCGGGGGGGDAAPRKVWAKLLNTAAKHFKKQMKSPPQRLLPKA